MATYVSLLRYTDQGIRNVKESPARHDAVKKAFLSMGAELKQFFLVSGEYDGIYVIEAPDAETAAKCVLAIGSLGNIRTKTFRAFPEGDYRKIIASLP